MNYIYLHGFASGTQSRKAQYLTDRFAEIGINLITPDLNLGDFSTITLSKQLTFLQDNYGNQPCYVMGSSLGGLLATLWAIVHTGIERLVLLAPAFRFSECLQQTIGEQEIEEWKTKGTRNFYHYGFGYEIPLLYEFFLDATRHDEKKLERELPILIIHGKSDDVVLPQRSREFAQERPYVDLRLVESDHSLSNIHEYIWQETQKFWQLAKQ